MENLQCLPYILQQILHLSSLLFFKVNFCSQTCNLQICMWVYTIQLCYTHLTITSYKIERTVTNNSRKNEAAGPKQKQCSVVDESGGESKV